MFGIGNDKAPGSDGFTSKFFKASWDIVEMMWPISCCSVLYKCISKIISDRIKPVLDRLVSRSQSAFIPGRRISDNILMAHELVAGYQKRSGPPRCAFKIDIRKAYDMVDWKYITIILEGFGFHPVLVRWIKEMLNTTSFSVAINGGSEGFFKGARGLRQGDPISPYLFTLVMEGFSMALKHYDLFVFTRGDVASVEVLKRALDMFRSWSGLAPSLEKSQVFFGNVADDVRHAILQTLPFEAGVFPIRYLGVPLSPLRLKVADYSGLIDKVRMRIHNWKSKSLSFAGRKLLISSVLQSLNLYWMSVFLLPSGVIHELEALMRNFLWAQGNSSRGKCKIAWDVVCRPIANGGLGLRKLATWNRAMVAKHLWDVLTSRSTLWVDWIRLHYSQDASLWMVVPKPTWSWMFRKLLELRPLIRRFVVSNIGNGLSTYAWSDRWLDCGALMDCITFRRFARLGFSHNTKVRQVIEVCGNEWPVEWIQCCGELDHCQIPAINVTSQDMVQWRRLDGSLGPFTVKDAYTDLSGSLESIRWATPVWFKNCIPKHAFCMWVACHGRLPTQDRLTWKHEPPDLICPLCGTCMDSHDHLFFLCSFSLEVWRTIKKDTRLFGFTEVWRDIRHNLTIGRGPRKLEQRLALHATIYGLWRERNRRLFGNTPKMAIQVIKEIREVVLMRMAWTSFDDIHGST
ncbi:hypothetical protein OSB04_un000349 [Centaurea solstitialis]|uniref:Reverse transcriptase domain-containing protein n=1 Tax=Centaurea solstitialis TaxID=347529 RepID=A0AA38SQN8_9ASTR|nr:hypothetical protein OSB04_un000349 [Centaurea solstitialis]